MNILSSIKGLSFSLPDLYQQLSNNGWQVKKVSYDKKRDKFLAVGKRGESDEELEAWGPSERVAVSNLLLNAIHRNGMRSSKLSMWTHTFTDQLPAIAEAYSKAPIYEPKAAIAFMELGRDAEARAKALVEHLEVTMVTNPEPYANAEKMCDDIRKRRKLEVSQAGIDHPIWSDQQVIAFRITFDVLGYCASGGDWGWEGTNRAFAAYAAMVPAEAQKALFTQVIGQTAYATYYRAYGPQKVALFNEFMDEAQSKENPHQHFRGIHPSQSYAPIPQPSVKPLLAHAGLDPIIAPRIPQKTAQALMDPNEGWQSGIAPLPQNAYLDHGDPLQGQETMNNAQLIDTEWAYLNQEDPKDLEQMKLAITNAFRTVLLSPRKDLKWNAVHYQDIAHIPASESDPSVYWDTLEQSRQNWNVQRHGEDARYAHMPYYKQWKALEQLMYQKNPQAGWPAAIDQAKAFLHRMQTRVQEQVMGEDADMPEDKQRHMYQIENESNKRLTQMLKGYIKEHQLGFDFESAVAEQTQMDIHTPSAEVPDKSKYGAWMGTHLQAISQVSEHVDEILKAALHDVHERDGTGHHFRASVLDLNLPGVGPKVCSFAWLLLQPLTSQLATIDTHMMGVLGHNYEKDMNPRDYFKFERELGAGRDAAGYGHIPLGPFQWGMWDAKRTGPGSHQDHSALKVLDPLPHEQVDWESKEGGDTGTNWTGPDWWKATQPARDAVGADWDQQVAPNVPAGQIPWNQGVPPAVYAKTAASSLTPWFTHPSTGEHIVGQPGQTIAQHAQSLGLSLPEIWALDAGKS